MVGSFSQNRVTLTGHLMILLSESDLTYPLCGVSCYVLLSAPGWFFTNMMIRWMTLKNLVLEDAMTQCSDRMVEGVTKQPVRKGIEQLDVTIPFTNSIDMMSEYSKLSKDLITQKKSLKDYGVVTLKEDCNAILENPKRLGDPW
ncbi:hypothetical protein HKD37_02G004504 [Glycine soja]